ncbi:hypothetical protein JW935_17000 [candidate division KSB1 bacterium]|nr:hypothetical protein [candidate division KSB1 bacterium]
MRILTIILILSSLLPYMNVSAKTKISCTWASGPIVVDGADDDWADVEVKKIKSLKTSMRMANQDSSLYIMLQFTDFEMASKVFMGGMTLWFDDDRHNGIRYQGTFAVADTLQKKAEANKASYSAARRFDAVLNLGKMLIIKDNRGYWVGGLETPTKAISCYQKGVFSYEFKIPLKISEGVPFGVVAKPGERITLCLQVGRGRGGFAPVDMMSAGSAEMGGGPGGGGGRGGGRGGGGMAGGDMGGGDMGGGMMGAGGGPGMGVQEEWFRVDLAGAPE